MIKLGTKVKDRTTGFAGVVVAYTKWLYGCTRYGVQSATLKDGVPTDAVWFDEQALDAAATEPGGPGAGSKETG